MVDNQVKKAKEFDLLDLGGPHKPAALEELEKDLEEVQERTKTLKEQYEVLECQIQGIVVRSSHEGDRSNVNATAAPIGTSE